MKHQNHYLYFQKQILLMIFLSLIPGIVYVVFGYIYDVFLPAILWYVAVWMTALYGVILYIWFATHKMEESELSRWYKHLIAFMYIIFLLWTVIFMLYSTEVKHHLHYIAIFTQLGASVVASALLFSERKIFIPILLILMLPLIGYFFLVATWYGYVLSLFSIIFLGVLIYASNNTYMLIQKNYYHAQHDALTGLYNRRYYMEYMQFMLDRLALNHKKAYILLIDLDYFKSINDSLGHDMGDKVLQEVASRIKNTCELSHFIARLGGDEFIVVSKDIDQEEYAQQKVIGYAENLLAILKEPYIIDGQHLYLSASIGVSQIDTNFSHSNNFLKEADIAMYEAKKAGRDGVITFSKELEESVNNTLVIKQKLYNALHDKKIYLNYQVQVNKNQEAIGCEVLARWDDDDLGIVPPDSFIPIAEKTGLIIELGAYILLETFKTIDEWHERGLKIAYISINISVRQLFYSTFIEEIESLMQQYVHPKNTIKIIFEITESILVSDVEKVTDIMLRLKALGIIFSMDDFGTGYSSLSYLRNLPIDELKIDKLFINHLLESETDKTMVRTMLSIAKNFSLNVVIEGIENEEQFIFLSQYHCDVFQGYHFSKPLSKEKFEERYLIKM